MPQIDSPSVLVARFLKTNSYEDTLDAFLREANLPPSAATTSPGALSLEKVLEEKLKFDATLRYEKVGSGGERKGWALPAPSTPRSINEQMKSPSNILCVYMFDPETVHIESQSRSFPLFVSSADRKIYCFDTRPSHFPLVSSSDYHKGPVLSFNQLRDDLLTTDMAGEVVHYGLHLTEPLSVERRIKDHSKYVVQSATFMDKEMNFSWLATAAWDKKVHVYCQYEHTKPLLDHRVATLEFPTNPESLLFIENLDTGQIMLVISRQDSTHLYFYEVLGHPSEAGGSYTCREAGKQNLAPHSNAWVSFTPSCLALCPTDKTLVAVATNHTPHMKLIIVRLLFPQTSAETTPAEATQASQARQALALQDREDAAILVHVSTMAPQTPYSTPQVCWRPDGTGVWVNGDDGFVRGVEVISGKIIVTLGDGHEAGSKVRTICAGNIVDEEGNEREILVSGGFDKRLAVWSVKNANSADGDN